MAESISDPQLTDQQQLAVIGYCMRNSDFYSRMRTMLRPEYFKNIKFRTIFSYVEAEYSRSMKPISEMYLESIIEQSQSDPQTIKVFKAHVSDAAQASTDITPERLKYLIAEQHKHLMAKNEAVHLGKAFADGNIEKIIESGAKLGELKNLRLSEAPSTAETLATLDKEEARWEQCLRNRIPMISSQLDRHFMLTPGITLMGGITKAGKSTVVANLVPAILDAFQQKKILVISNEDGLDMVATRVACCSLGVNLKDYRFHPNTMNPDLVQLVKQRKRDVAARIVVASVADRDTTNLEVVQDLLMDAKEQPDTYSAIILDYYQIVATTKKGGPSVHPHDVSKKFGLWLKGFSADLTIPMILFAQLKPTFENQDLPISQRVQGDMTLANHVQVALEIVKRKGETGGNFTDVICHLSRHGDTPGPVATFEYNFGRLEYKPRPT